MLDPTYSGYVKDGVYILATILFIYALHEMSNPATARKGVLWAGAGMFLAVLVTAVFSGASPGAFVPGINISQAQLEENLGLMAIAIAIGGGLAYLWAIRVKMTDMPQMVAIYNGMGGGAAAGIAALALIARTDTVGYLGLAVVGGLIGSVSFAGSLIAFLKLQGWMRQKPITFPGQQAINIIVLLAAIVFGAVTLLNDSGHAGAIGTTVAIPFVGINTALLLFFVLGLGYGFMMAIPIGGADMPVVISMLNSYSGWAAAGIGFTLANTALIITGALVGSSGAILSYIMCKGMNRSFISVILGGFGGETAAAAGGAEARPVKQGSADDAAFVMKNAGSVIIVPGYGMAVAQAQHALREMADHLKKAGVTVKYAIHPVAGRMPGHMNVLLAEANVPYDEVFELEDINSEFAQSDVAFVIGANDVTNPAAKDDPASPIFGMPVLEVWKANTVMFIKRGMSSGYAGIDNGLFYRDNTMMLFGDAKKMTEEIVKAM